MPELDAFDDFERRFAAAYRRYLGGVPTTVDATAIARAAAVAPRARRIALPWTLRPAPALAWLVLLGLLLAALGASALFVASQRPALGLACPAGTNPDAPAPAGQARPAVDLGQSGIQSANPVYDRQSRKVVVLDWTRAWTFDVCTNTWARLGERPITQEAAVRLAYDPGTDLTIAVGATGSTWAYDVDTDTWDSRTSAPWVLTDPGRVPGWVRLAYLPDTGRVLALIGAFDGSWRAMWTYDPERDAWTNGPAFTNAPQHRWDGDGRFSSYDASAGRVIAYLPDCGDCTGDDQTWLLDPSTGAWSRAASDTPNVYRDWVEADGEVAYDEAARLTLIYGLGIGGDTWSAGVIGFDANAQSWRTLQASRTLAWTDPPKAVASTPGARMHHWLVYDAANERTILLGGEREADGTGTSRGWVSADDAWAFDATTRTWTQLLPPSTP